MRRTIEAKFFHDDNREMVSFHLPGKGGDAVNTMSVNRFKRDHPGLWREVATLHEAWSGGKAEADEAAEEPKAEAPRKRVKKATA
jgi:hypothetical protein